jgi:hypothetical protein
LFLVFIYFVGLKAPVYQFLAQAHFFEKISRINFFDSKSVAIRAIYRRLERDIFVSGFYFLLKIPTKLIDTSKRIYYQ